MSFIILACTQEFALLLGDTRLIHKSDEGIESIIDDYALVPKVFQINSKIIAGFTGNYRDTLRFIRKLCKMNSIDRSLLSINAVQRLFIEFCSETNAELRCIMAGKSDEGEISIFTANENNTYATEYVNKGDMLLRYSVPYDVNLRLAEEKFRLLIKGDTYNSLVQCVIHIASLSKSVNSRIFGIKLLWNGESKEYFHNMTINDILSITECFSKFLD